MCPRCQAFSASTVSGILPAIDAGIDGRFALVLDGPEGVRRLAAQSVLVAPGCYDMPVLFPGWNLPGLDPDGKLGGILRLGGAVPVVGVDHIRAHLYAGCLDAPTTVAPLPEWPALGLVVSAIVAYATATIPGVMETMYTVSGGRITGQHVHGQRVHPRRRGSRINAPAPPRAARSRARAASAAGR